MALRPIFVLFALAIPLAAQAELGKVLKGIEDRYNRPRTMQMDFELSQGGAGRITRTESGQLFLKKPGLMRWTYREPEGKFFLTDAKYSYYYSPTAGQVSRSLLKNAEDMRAPLGFLMGRLDFQRDFKEFRTNAEGPNTYVIAAPKSEKAAYTQVEFLVTPQYQILVLRITGQDGTVMRYKLSAEKQNPALAASLFQFNKPEGVDVVDEP
jgi:outer membrane lipoprotein carrier protein